MRGSRNPVIEEGIQLYASGEDARRFYAMYVIFLSIFLIFLWPGSGYVRFYFYQSQPVVFEFGLFVFPVLLSLAGGYFGINSIGKDEFIRLSDWMVRTPVSTRAIILGKLLLAWGHTGMLILLGLPLFILCAAPAGISAGPLALSLLILYLCAVVGRLWGLVVLSFLERHRALTVLLLWGGLIAYLYTTARSLPGLNPVIILVNIHSAWRTSAGANYFYARITNFSTARAVALTLGLALTLSLLAALVMWVRSQREPEVVVDE